MKVLVVIDAQNDFITGVLGSQEAQEAIPYIASKVNHAMNDLDLIVYTQDTHFDNYMDTNEAKYLPVPHCIENTWGWMVADEVDVVAQHIPKYTFGCHALPQYLMDLAALSDAEITEIEICGFCTDICVISNALILKSVFAPMNIDITVDAKACAGVTPEKHAAALEVMKSCQIIVKE